MTDHVELHDADEAEDDEFPDPKNDVVEEPPPPDTAREVSHPGFGVPMEGIEVKEGETATITGEDDPSQGREDVDK